MLGTILLIAGTWLTAEVVGYFLHKLLHRPYRLTRWLYIYHMEHHLLHYPPRTNQRSLVYRGPKKEHPQVLGLGLEWFIPGGILLGLLIGIEWLIGLSGWEIALSSGFILTYSIVMFWVVHDSFHVQDHWLTKNPLTRGWFLRMRKIHDRHHHLVDEDGVIRANYGISTDLCDHVFGTHKTSEDMRKMGLSHAAIVKANQHLDDLRRAS